jgi:hypothetical protein
MLSSTRVPNGLLLANFVVPIVFLFDPIFAYCRHKAPITTQFVYVHIVNSM